MSDLPVTHAVPEEGDQRSGAMRLAFLALGPFLALLTWYLIGPSMSDSARSAAALVVLMAIWWLGEAMPLAVTSLVPAVLGPLLGILPLREAAAPYADRLIFLFLGGFVLALAMERWHLHRRIALNTVLLVGTRPRRLVLGFMIATAFLSAWMSNAATTVLMLPIGISIMRLVEDRTENHAGTFGLCLMLGIAYSASIGGVATPIGSPPNATLIAYLHKTYGIELTFSNWFRFALPFVLLFLPIAWLVLTRLVYPIKLREIPGGRQLIRSQRDALGPLSRGEKLVMVSFCVAVIGWIGREPLQAIWPGIKPFLGKRLDDTSVALFAAVLMFVLPVDLKRGVFVMDWRTASRMPWDVLLLFGGGLSLAACIQASGLDRAVGEMIGKNEHLPHAVILLLVITVSVFLSEITSNTAQANIFLPILGVVATSLNIDPRLMLIPVTFALSCAFMMPMGTPPNALVFSSGRVTIRQMAKAGIVLNIITIALAMLMAYTIVPLALHVMG